MLEFCNIPFGIWVLPNRGAQSGLLKFFFLNWELGGEIRWVLGQILCSLIPWTESVMLSSLTQHSNNYIVSVTFFRGRRVILFCFLFNFSYLNWPACSRCSGDIFWWTEWAKEGNSWQANSQGLCLPVLCPLLRCLFLARVGEIIPCYVWGAQICWHLFVIGEEKCQDF